MTKNLIYELTKPVDLATQVKQRPVMEHCAKCDELVVPGSRCSHCGMLGARGSYDGVVAQHTLGL